jgi:hypothetical protein
MPKIRMALLKNVETLIVILGFQILRIIIIIVK